jgi:glycosyltransferase involved in cell wall biosynthesis
MCQAFSENGFDVVLFARQQLDVAEFPKFLGFEPLFGFVDTFGIPPRRWRFVFYLSELIFVLSFLWRSRGRDFDLLYCRSEWTLFFLLPFVDSKKMVWESHEARWNYPARQIVKGGVKVIAISDAIKEDYIKYGVPAEKIHVAYDGIDEGFFAALETKEQARDRLGLSPDAFIAMYVGGLDEWKGAPLFMQAAGLVENIVWVIIGGRPEEVEVFSKRYPDVRFLGPRPYHELKHNQQAADILVIPNSGKTNLAARYTSPLKLFSYMTSGVPIVASDVPSITSVIGKEAACLFKPDSVTALADAVKQCSVAWPEYVQRAQNLARESTKYTWMERAAGIKRFLLH